MPSTTTLPALPLLLLLLAASTAEASTFVRGICPNKTPKLAKFGDSCGVPGFVDKTVFGDNANTNGYMRLKPLRRGLALDITVRDLPRPDLVLTAWLVWVPGGVTKPKIFEVANHACPCAPYTARYGTGLSRDPNTLRYVSKTKAKLNVHLNFNPTYGGEGALTRETFTFQKDVPGIQKTRYRQYATPGGVFIPTSSSYLRTFARRTGFEKLDYRRRPFVVRSPVRALGVEIIAHVDKTTHGISQGVGGVDHYFMLFFPFEGAVGRRTRKVKGTKA